MRYAWIGLLVLLLAGCAGYLPPTGFPAAPVHD
jgi:hypothetical protein